MYDHVRYWEGLHKSERGRLSAVGHPALGEGFNRVAYGLRLAAAERLLRREGPAPLECVLEAAAGVGAYGPLWAALGARRWVGLDLSPTAVEELRRRFPAHRFVQADITQGLGVGDERFCLVTAIDVLYHVVDDAAFARALEHLAGAVRPGGCLLVSDIFPAEVRRTAEHVVRRPLALYEELLAPHGLALAAREPVMAILDQPLPREGRLLDRALLLGWRVLGKTVRSVPGAARGAAGAAMARALVPLDRGLRRLGLSRGVNLELALFRRR